MLKAFAAGSGCALVPPSMFAATLGDDGLARSSPAEAGIDAEAVLDYVDRVFANDLDLHSIMLYRHGNVVAEGWSWPYASHRPHMMHSLTKSVNVCGVGLAIDEGYFSLDDPVTDFFDGELPETVSDNLRAMTVRDLLTMQSGHAESVSGSVFRPIKTSWVTEFFKIPVVYEPGTHYLYSSAVSFMLSAIVTRTTGESVRDFLKPRMLEPLGITGLTWGSSPAGISSGGNGLTWKTVDSLKLGILHLNKGKWAGERVLPAAWVTEATRAQVPGGHYGYQWWVNDDADAYFAVGAFGQYAIVFPNHDAVLALTAGVQSSSSLREIAWEYFPEAFEGGASEAADSQLRHRLDTLRLLPQPQRTSSPLSRSVSGNTYRFGDNEDNVTTVRMEFGDDAMDFRMSDHRGDHVVRVGLSDWIESQTGITGNKLHHQYQANDMRVVAYGRWWDDQTFEMTWQFVETAWVDHVVCRFFGNRISIDRRTNANYAPRVAATLRGRAD